MSKEYQQQNIVYKDKKGKILTEKDILQRWQQYFQLLLEDELQPLEETGTENENIEELEDTDKPTYNEMTEVISNMKNGKAPGIDNITVELIKNGGPELLQRILLQRILLQRIYTKNSSSTCFRHLYAHRQEVRLRFHCLSFSVLLWLLRCWRVG